MKNSNSLFRIRSDVILTDFIAQVDNELQDKNLDIINSPELKTQHQLRRVQQIISDQQNKLGKYALLGGTTAGLVYFSPGDKNGGQVWKELEMDKIREYYSQYAQIILEDKKCTCDGLCSVVFELAKQNLKNYSENNITVEICSLRNWSHTLMHFTQRKINGEIESLFYDPWYQRCYTKEPVIPKIFSDDSLNSEMKKLIEKSTMIQPTKELMHLNSDQQFTKVTNTRSDFSYFIACSTDEFSNPAKEIEVPEITKALSFGCMIS
jgi:hypothetical protein